MSHMFTILFWFLFVSYIFLALMDVDGRPLEFILGVFLFGMLDEYYHNSIEKKKKVKR